MARTIEDASAARATWADVDDYIARFLVPPDPVLAAALQAGVAAGLPQIQVSPLQAKLLYLLARLAGARSILEIGTLAGYSTIWLARALPWDGRLVSLEVNATHAEVARANLARAGLAGVVEVRVGRGLDLLPALAAEGRGPFDLVFVDADKEHTADYVGWALRLARPGTVIVVDNVVRRGGVLDATSDDADLRGVRRMYELVAAEPRLEATAIQTVGVKGYDGFALLRVRGE